MATLISTISVTATYYAYKSLTPPCDDNTSTSLKKEYEHMHSYHDYILSNSSLHDRVSTRLPYQVNDNQNNESAN